MSAIFEFLFYAIAGLFGLWLACVLLAGAATVLAFACAWIERLVRGKDKG